MSGIWTPPDHGRIIKPGDSEWDDPTHPAWGSLAQHPEHNFFHQYKPDPKGSPLRDDDYDVRISGRDADRGRRGLQDSVDPGHVAIRVTPHALSSVLLDGRFKSQFEVGRSNGLFNPTRRMYHESHWFGPQAEFHHPIYGYLAESHDDGSQRRADELDQYGTNIVVLKKPRVWHRTTTTFTDSFDDPFRLRPSPVQHVSLHSYPLGAELHGRDGGPYSKHVLGHMLRHSLSGPPIDSYTEAQVHGGVTRDDISHVVIRTKENRSGQPNQNPDDVKRALDNYGIPWVHRRVSRYGVDQDFDDWTKTSLLRYYQAILEGGHMSQSEVVAEREGGIYLLYVGEKNGRPQGQVADTQTGVLHAPHSLDSIMARGYWEKPKDGVDAEDILALVKPV